MRAAILAATGVEITDTDGDGLADTPEQVAAIYAYAKDNDVTNNDGVTVFRPDQTERFLFISDEGQATTVAVGIATFTDDKIILAARDVLDSAAAGIEPQLSAAGVSVAVSGGAITSQDSLDSFLRTRLTSLPIAIVLTSLFVFVTLFFVFRNFGGRVASIL